MGNIASKGVWFSSNAIEDGADHLPFLVALDFLLSNSCSKKGPRDFQVVVNGGDSLPERQLQIARATYE